MPRTTKTPAYKRTDQAVVTLNGRDYYLGKHGTGASRQAYDRLIGECARVQQSGFRMSRAH